VVMCKSDAFEEVGGPKKKGEVDYREHKYLIRKGKRGGKGQISRKERGRERSEGHPKRVLPIMF